MNEYEVIILGATMAGLGAAYADKKNSIIIERRSQLGYEFINSFRTGTDWEDDNAADLKKEMIKYNIITNDGNVYIPALAPLLFNMAKNTNISLMTDIISITEDNNLFKIDVYNACGFNTYYSKRILDTRTHESDISTKSINAVISSPIMIETVSWDSSLSFEKRQNIANLSVPKSADFILARKMLCDVWSKRAENQRHLSIAAVGDYFCEEVITEKEIISENYIRLISSYFKNPLKAFDAGRFLTWC